MTTVSKSVTNEINVSSTETSNHVVIPTSDDDEATAKVNRQDAKKKRGYSCLEWIQLIAAVWIPIVIAIYTVVDNVSNASNAANNRLKDIEIANMSRMSESEIAQNNRLNEIAIAELSRQKDRDLAIDQQKENILVGYQAFLAKLIIDNGIDLSWTSGAKRAGHFMTLTTLSQLDMKRRSILLRSLYNAKLITFQKSNDQVIQSTISLEQVDLSDINFGLFVNVPHRLQRYHYIPWTYLWLPNTILTNASLRHTTLDCADFSRATMNSADLSFSMHQMITCYNPIRQGQTSFLGASLVNATLYDVSFRFTEFARANLTFANMQKFYCLECNFSSAILFQADLSFSRIFHGHTLHKGRLFFDSANLIQAVARSAVYRTINFDNSDWSNAQASEISIFNCTFISAKMDNCSFVKSNIQKSVFQNARLYMIDLSNAALDTVSFINSDMQYANLSYIKCDYCDFTNVTLYGAVLKNASFRHSNFLNSRVNVSQIEEAIDLFGSTLPNGTEVTNDD